MPTNIKLSVHQLVDFLLRSGDIDTRVFNRSSMNEGSKIHSQYQSLQDKNYVSEYALSQTFTIDGISITLEGRADGIIKHGDKEYVIDEIKSTVQDLKTFKETNFNWHIGQAKCYAYMFMHEQHLDYIGIKLTYIKQGEEKDKLIENYVFSKSNLEQYVYSLLEEYLSFYSLIMRYQNERNESINKLNFPFTNFRRGQKELSKICYAIAKNGGKLFVEAPTGIGKTMSTLYPFIKSLPFDDKSKIFYLTAKTSGKESAYQAIEILKKNGLVINDIVITAKEKACFCKGKGCNPDECPFAKGYYNKIQSIIRFTLANYSTYDAHLINRLAYEYEVCPFEFSLDLSLFADIIICDYNYMFDPLSYFKRYFDEDSSHYLALVDEAHNLIDLSREMYRASISRVKLYLAKNSLADKKKLKVKNRLNKIKQIFKEYSEKCNESNPYIVEDFTAKEYKALEHLVSECQDINKNDSKSMTPELMEFYLDVNRFLKVADMVSPRYISYASNEANDFTLNHFCLDASLFLKNTFSRIKGSVIFSATLSPIDYYINSLGGDNINDPHINLASPFNQNHLKIIIAPKVSVKYKNREASYPMVKEYIANFIKNKVGNYFIYSPSYEYMEHLLSYLNFEDVDIFVQKKDMSDLEKEEFLLNFKESPSKTTLGFLVLGGAFSEGIDLVSDRLIGAVIIGIGMPRLNFASDNIATYYKNKELPGHDYAYTNPGMNKVQQAVGRVIRSEDDYGAVLLIDERYMHRNYQNLFRNEWGHYIISYTPDDIIEPLKTFFKENESDTFSPNLSK